MFKILSNMTSAQDFYCDIEDLLAIQGLCLEKVLGNHEFKNNCMNIKHGKIEYFSFLCLIILPSQANEFASWLLDWKVRKWRYNSQISLN